MESVIRFVLGNVSMVMLVLALVIGFVQSRKFEPGRQRLFIFLGYLMVLAYGVSGVWGFVVEWQARPEMAVANLGIGLAGLFGFRHDFGYWLATNIVGAGVLWGAAVGQTISLGGGGTNFYGDILIPLVGFYLLWKYQKGLVA